MTDSGIVSKTTEVPVREPYKGLRPYEESDQDFFFGRDAERRILIDKILTNRLTLLFAATGVGKSSLLQAAVVPHLKDARHENLVVVVYNDWVTPPLEGLKSKILDTLRTGDYLGDDATVSDFAEQTLPEFFRLAALVDRPPLVVILDQFEELFRYQRQAEQFEPFVRQLSAAMADRDNPVAFVISMREDFALELNAFRPYLPTILFEDYYRLERLTPENAEKAIVEPLRRVGFEIEDTLLGDLRKHLVQRDEVGGFTAPLAGWVDKVAPPYLQIVCSQLWELECENPDKVLRLRTYRQSGEAKGLLRSYVDRVLRRFSAEERLLSSRAFDHLVSRHGTKVAYTAHQLAKTVGADTGAMEKVLGKLEGARILRRQQRKKVIWFELYHDLFSPIVDGWNDRFKADRRLKQTITWTGITFALLAALFVTYDVVLNLTSYHYRMSFRPDDDRVELYRGAAGSWDLFGLQQFVAETDFQRSQLEPDKRERKKRGPGTEYSSADLIGDLPTEERLQEYWNAGWAEKALAVGDRSIVEDVEDTRVLVAELRGLRSLEVAKLLSTRLESSDDHFLRANLITGLQELRATPALDTLIREFEDSSLAREEIFAAIGTYPDPLALEKLLRHVEDPEVSIRLEAVEALGQHDPALVLEPLVQSLDDRDRQIRQTAAEVLGTLGDPEALQPLLDLLESDTSTRPAVVQALGNLGQPEAIDPLVPLLEDPALRDPVSSALSRLNSHEFLPHAVESLVEDARIYGFWTVADDLEGGPIWSRVRGLPPDGLRRLWIEHLRSPDSPSRLLAIRALGESGRLEFQADLAQLLGSYSGLTNLWAAEILVGWGQPEPLPILLTAVESPSAAGLHYTVIDQLGTLGSPQAIPALVELLDQTKYTGKAAQALANTGVDWSRALSDRLEEPESRGVVVSALKHLGNPRAVDPLMDLIDQDFDRHLRREFVIALAQTGDTRVFGALIEFLEDSDPGVRSDAASALGILADARAEIPLIQRLQDPYQSVRQSVVGALAKLGTAQASTPLLEQLTGRGGADASVAIRDLRSQRFTLANQRRLLRHQRSRGFARLRRSSTSSGSSASPESHLTSFQWRERYKAILSSAREPDEMTLAGLETLLRDPGEILPVRIRAAAALLALDSDEGLPLLQSSAASPLAFLRRQVATTLSELSFEGAHAVLAPLVQDPARDIRLTALEALGKDSSTGSLELLHEALGDPDVRVRQAAAESIAAIASADSIPVIRSALTNRPTDIGAHRHLLEALAAIGTEEAIAELLAAVQENEWVLGLRTYLLFGDLGPELGSLRPEVLDWLDQRRKALTEATRKWRAHRDTRRRDFTDDEFSAWETELEQVTPEWHWAFELAYATSRIDPGDRGIALLSHELTDVRYGAWMGIADVASVDLIERLDAMRAEDGRSSLFRDAAYRAIDRSLRRLERKSTDDQLAALEKLLPGVHDKQAVCTRMEWTIHRLERARDASRENVPVFSGHCQIDWREAP